MKSDNYLKDCFIKYEKVRRSGKYNIIFRGYNYEMCRDTLNYLNNNYTVTKDHSSCNGQGYGIDVYN